MPRLRRSPLRGPRIARVRRGRGFAYVDADGAPVRGPTFDRIAELAIPPAWETCGSAAAQRPHPGHRDGRRGSAPVPLPPGGAAAGRGQARTGAELRAGCRGRERDQAAEHLASSGCRPNARWPRRSRCSTSASSRSAARRTRRRTALRLGHHVRPRRRSASAVTSSCSSTRQVRSGAVMSTRADTDLLAAVKR